MPIKDLKVELTPHIKKAEIFARRSMLSKMLEGSWATTFKGRGIEFAGYRPYQYGDDASTIDWRASLRSKDPLVREFEEYKSFKVFIMLDISNSMLFSSTNKLKAEYAAELAYSLGEAILQSGDAVGLGMFNDKYVGRVDPDIGSGMTEKMSKLLLNKNNYGGNFDFRYVVKQTMSFLRGQAVLVIISDFLGMKKGWEKYARMMGEYFEVLAIMVRDPRDRKLPRGVGQYSVEDPYSNDYLYIDVNKYEKEYEEIVRADEARIRRVFEGIKGGFVLVQTDKDYVDTLMRFLRKREFVTATI